MVVAKVTPTTCQQIEEQVEFSLVTSLSVVFQTPYIRIPEISPDLRNQNPLEYGEGITALSKPFNIP